MDLKFKDYLCLVMPPLASLAMYVGIICGICVLFNLSDCGQLIISMVPTIIFIFPWLKVFYKYIEWYYREYMEDR